MCFLSSPSPESLCILQLHQSNQGQSGNKDAVRRQSKAKPGKMSHFSAFSCCSGWARPSAPTLAINHQLSVINHHPSAISIRNITTTGPLVFFTGQISVLVQCFGLVVKFQGGMQLVSQPLHIPLGFHIHQVVVSPPDIFSESRLASLFSIWGWLCSWRIWIC